VSCCSRQRRAAAYQHGPAHARDDKCGAQFHGPAARFAMDKY
jgi:hypothetical protein